VKMCTWCRADYRFGRCERCGESEATPTQTKGTLPPCPLDRGLFEEWSVVESVTRPTLQCVDVPIREFGYSEGERVRYFRVAAVDPADAQQLADRCRRDVARAPDGRVVDLLAHRSAQVMRFPVWEAFNPSIPVIPSARVSDVAIGRRPGS
jgi:hypothetical protein